MRMKALLAALLCAGWALHGSDLAHAQSQAYPDRPIKMVVPFPAGGPTDNMARIISDRLGAVLGQSVVVDNRGGGAGGSIGAKAVATAEPDGYTILITPGGSLTTGPAVHKNIGYDPTKAFVPVASSSSRRSSCARTRTCRRRRWPSSWPTPRPTRARSAGARRASAPRRTCSPSCSSSRPAPTSCTCPIAGRRPCSPPPWPGRSRSSSIRPRPRCRKSKPACCGRWRSPRSNASRNCRTCRRRRRRDFRACKTRSGSAWLRRPERRPRLSTS